MSMVFCLCTTGPIRTTFHWVYLLYVVYSVLHLFCVTKRGILHTKIPYFYKKICACYMKFQSPFI